MTQLQAPVEPALVLRRTYDAPREHVFAAWTQPEIAARFLGPGDVRASEVAMDVRPGGSYRIVMLMPDESTMVARGTYIEVVKPDRLSMTWGWEEDDPSQEHESLLTLEFVARGERTELILTHERLASVESRDNHEQGWTAILDQLGATVGKQ